MLELALLGRPAVSWHGQPVTGFVSEKALVLLAFLVMRRGSHSRDALADLLWGEMAQKRARANLRMALYNLNDLLPNCLDADRKTISFCEEVSCQLDLDILNSAFEGDSLSDLEAAIGCYRGEFLDGIALSDSPAAEEWLRDEREFWRQRFVTLLDRQLSDALSRGEWQRAISLLRHLLAIEPWQEENHRMLMRLLARAGQHTAALHHFEQCNAILAEELGLQPMPETTRLAEHIKAARSRDLPATLPLTRPPLIGRREELGQLHQLLALDKAQLITIVGPGGTGKSRLALAAANQEAYNFLDGVFWISLAPVSDVDGLLPAIAQAVGCRFSGGRTLQDQLIAFLRPREMLLVLDNFEHLVAGVDQLIPLLNQVPAITLLVTSRERLNLRCESLLPLMGLPFPTSASDPALIDFDALQLFATSARQVRPDFDLAAESAAVLRICQLVDGLPLALELAAGIVDQRSVAQIADAVSETMDVLTTTARDLPPRHHSLRATWEHSWALLNDEERQLFKSLSIFGGWFTADAAQQVAGATRALLVQLHAKSLLRASGNDRYMIHPVLREFGAERLSINDTEYLDIGRRHSQFFLSWVELQNEIDQSELARRQAISTELDNLRAAWRWAVANRDLLALQRAAPPLASFWVYANRWQEGAAEIAIARRVAAESNDRTLLATLLLWEARLLGKLARYNEGIEAVNRAINLAESGNEPIQQGVANLYLGWMRMMQGRLKMAEAALNQVLALTSERSPKLQADALRTLGTISLRRGCFDAAVDYYQQSLDITERIGDERGRNASLGNLGLTLFRQGHFNAATEMLSEALATYQRLDDLSSLAQTRCYLGEVHLARGALCDAEAQFQQAWQEFQSLDDRQHESEALEGLVKIALRTDRLGQAQRLLDRAMELARAKGDRRAESALLHLQGLHAVRLGTVNTAQARFAEAVKLRRQIGDLPGIAETEAELAALAPSLA